MEYWIAQVVICLLVGYPFVQYVAPAMDGDTRHKIDKFEDDVEEAQRLLPLMQPRRVA
jgi:hypothetical protein